MNRFAILILIALLTFGSVTYAQDADPGDDAPIATLQVSASEAAPVEEPVTDAPDTDTVSDSALISVLFGTVVAMGVMLVIFMAVIVYQNKVITDAGIKNSINAGEIIREVGKLYPADAIDKLMERERLKATSTDTPIDDIVTTVTAEVAERIAAIIEDFTQTSSRKSAPENTAITAG